MLLTLPNFKPRRAGYESIYYWHNNKQHNQRPTLSEKNTDFCKILSFGIITQANSEQATAI